MLTFRVKDDDRNQWFIYRVGNSSTEGTMFGRMIGETPILSTDYAVQRAIELLDGNNEAQYKAGQDVRKEFGFVCICASDFDKEKTSE